MSTETTIVELGSEIEDGYAVTIARGFEDGTGDYANTYVKYRCYGVGDVSIDTPWDIGSGKCCNITVWFTTGESVHLTGVVEDIHVGGPDE